MGVFSDEQVRVLNEWVRTSPALMAEFPYAPSGGLGLGDLLNSLGTGAVTSVFGRTGAIVAVDGDYDADQVDYDNTTSGLTATDVQAAIDEVDSTVDGLPTAWTDLSDTPGSITANQFVRGNGAGTALVFFDLFNEANTWTEDQTFDNVLVNANATYDIGASGTAFRTLYLDNDGGTVIDLPTAITTGSRTDYTMDLGGGSSGISVGEGGDFTMAFDDMTGVGTDINVFNTDFGQPSFSALHVYRNRTIDTVFSTFGAIQFENRLGIGSGGGPEVQFNANNSGSGVMRMVFASTGQLNFNAAGSSGVSGTTGLNFSSVAGHNIILNATNAEVNTQIRSTTTTPFFLGGSTVWNNGDGAIMMGRSPGTSNLGAFVNIDSPAPAGDTFTPTITNPTTYGSLRVTMAQGLILPKNLTTVASAYFSEPNITLDGNTLTNAATVYIENAPTEGSNNYALFVDAGDARFDEDVIVNGDFDHQGSNVGFFGAGPQAQTSAYTQTYSTASRTHANPTGVTLTGPGGTADTTLVSISGTGDDSNINDNFEDIVDQVNNLVSDVANAKQVLNSVIDDLQTYGLLQ